MRNGTQRSRSSLIGILSLIFWILSLTMNCLLFTISFLHLMANLRLLLGGKLHQCVLPSCGQAGTC
jgi:K+ transporter